jgi:hypothetical protein
MVNLPVRIEEIDTLVDACLSYTKDYQVLLNGFCGADTFYDIPQSGKCFDGVFCIVVVPGDPIIAKESEQLIAVFLKPLFAFLNHLTARFDLSNPFIETPHIHEMFFKVVPFEAKSVYGFNHWFQQSCEVSDDLLKIVVERMIQGCIVQIANKVDETFLLRTFEGFVCSIEVRNENTFEFAQEVFHHFTLAAV